MPTKKKRQPVQIDEDIMKQLRELSNDLGGLPITRLVRVACEGYLKNHPLRHEAARKVLMKMKADGTPVTLLWNPEAAETDRKKMRLIKRGLGLMDKAKKLSKRREALSKQREALTAK